MGGAVGMKTISLDPVTLALLLTGHLSFVTVDHPPPDGWIGQRVALYAEKGYSYDDWDRSGFLSDEVARSLPFDAIVGSGTLAEALPIIGEEQPRSGKAIRRCRPLGSPPDAPEKLLLIDGSYDPRVTHLTDLLPLQDWTPGRWALQFTDVAPTSERCVWPGCANGKVLDMGWPDGFPHLTDCPTHQAPVLAPVLSGDDPMYREWAV